MSGVVAGDASELRIPRPAVYAAALHAFIWADPWSHSPSEVMRGLVEPPFVSSEVGCMPVAIAGVLPLLRGDMERLRFAVLTAHTFDLFEVAAVAVDLAVSARDEALVLEAASLCGNLAVDASVRRQMLEWVGAGSMTRIRINPAAVPRSEDEEYLRHQCWPGTRGTGSQVPHRPQCRHWLRPRSRSQSAARHSRR